MGKIIWKVILLTIVASLIASPLTASYLSVDDDVIVDPVSDTPPIIVIPIIVNSTLGLMDHDVIYIDNDTEFVGMVTSEGWGGNGTADSPYEIERYRINATGHGAGIYIGNTTVHFVITNCVLNSSDTPEFFSLPFPGCYNILLNNVTNGVVMKSICYDSDVGICTAFSNNCTVNNNSVSLITTYAILLSFSPDITVDGNICYDSPYGIAAGMLSDRSIISNSTCRNNTYGIYALSSNNTIENNMMTDVYIGIHLLLGAADNVISDSTISNSSAGIYVAASSRTSIVRNVIDNCLEIGIGIDASEDTNLIGNDLRQCDRGISVVSGSASTTVSGNVLVDNNYGISFSDSCWNTIDNNTLLGNDFGVLLRDASDTTEIEFNTFENNYHGVELNGTTGVSINNNTIRNSADGIHMVAGSNLVSIVNNIFQNNYCGAYLLNCGFDEISNNTMTGNIFGIQLDGSDDMLISNNLIQDSAGYAISAMRGSDDSMIFGNAFVNNNGATDVFDLGHVQVYDDGTNTWNGSEHGNYWSDWLTPDNDNDSIVDVAYVIVSGLNTDQLPMTTSDLYAAPLIGNVSGIVTDEDNNTLANVTVFLSNGLSTVTDAYGMFSLQNVTAGTYVITFSKVNYTVEQQNVTVTDDETEDMGAIELSAELTEDDLSDEGDDASVAYYALVIVVLVAVAAIVLMYFRMKK